MSIRNAIERSFQAQDQIPDNSEQPEGQVETLRCLFTTQKSKKRKVWQDGVVKCCRFSGSVTLFRWSDAIGLNGNMLGEIFLAKVAFDAFVDRSEPELEFELYLVSIDGVTENLTTNTAPVPKYSFQKDAFVTAKTSNITKKFKMPSRIIPVESPSDCEVYSHLRSSHVDCPIADSKDLNLEGDFRRPASINNGFGAIKSLWEDENSTEECQSSVMQNLLEHSQKNRKCSSNNYAAHESPEIGQNFDAPNREKFSSNFYNREQSTIPLKSPGELRWTAGISPQKETTSPLANLGKYSSSPKLPKFLSGDIENNPCGQKRSITEMLSLFDDFEPSDEV